MKALIRESEIITEPFDKWIAEHIAWLTTARPDGDGYTLIDNYEPPEDKCEPPEGYYDEVQ